MSRKELRGTGPGNHIAAVAEVIVTGVVREFSMLLITASSHTDVNARGGWPLLSAHFHQR